jgi:cell shape-determining protein MreC
MNFLLKSKPKKTFDSKTVIAISVFLLFLVLSVIFPGFFRGTTQALMKPLWLFRYKTGDTFSFAWNFISFKSSLIKENELLKDELGRLRLTKIDYDVLFKENEELKAMLSMKKSSMRAVANVLSKPPQSPFDTMVLASGKNAGIEIGNKVYISDNIIIGQISDVSDETSVVKLFSTGGEKIEVILLRTGQSFVITGSGGENFSLEIPKDTDIVWGDSLVLQGSSDFVLATVYFVDSSSQSSFKTVHMRVPGNLYQTKRVFVGS